MFNGIRARRACRRWMQIDVKVVAVTLLMTGAFAAIVAPAGKCNASGTPSPSIAGLVTDSSGAPLARARVLIYTAGLRTGIDYQCPSCYADCAKSATTDAHGRFNISSLDSSLVFRLLILHPGFQPKFVNHIDPQAEHGGVAVQLSPGQQFDPGQAFTGKILGPMGAPVAGATVEPKGLDGPAGKLEGTPSDDGRIDPLAVTDQDGRFVLCVKQTPALVMVLVKARGLAPTVTPFLPTGTPATIRLSDGATISGSVVSKSGKPLGGVTIRIAATDSNMETFTGFTDIGTDSKGRFIAYNLPIDREYEVCVPMDIAGRQNLGAPKIFVTVAGDDSTTKTTPIVLRPSSTVAGRITLSDGATIPSDARVSISRTCDGFQGEIAADGTYSFSGVPRAEHINLSVNVPHYHIAASTPGLNPNPYFQCIQRTTPSDGAPSKIDITMIPDTVTK